jgi:apolipoprotein N-acyltransferase
MQPIFGRKTKLEALILAFISAVILALALNCRQLWILEWIGLVPLFIALNKSKQNIHITAIAFSVTYFGITLYWMFIFGFLPWLALTLFQSAYLYVFCLLAAFFIKRIKPSLLTVALPSLWVVIQFIRSLGAFGFTWGSLCHSQAYNLPILQIASITGCWGIDFLVCFFNLAISEVFSKKFKPIIAASVLVVLISAYGYFQIRDYEDDGKAISIRIVQGNLDQYVIPDDIYIRNTLSVYIPSSVSIGKDHPKIVIWPETTLPIDLENSDYNQQIQKLSDALDITLIIGAYTRIKLLKNSAYFYEPNAAKPKHYSKVHLVPFGEYVPFRKQLKFVRRYGVRPDDLEPGLSYQPIAAKQGNIGTVICFESLFPQISRLLTKREADYLVIITNDTWFKNTQAARLHFAMAKIRAVENHRWVIRGAATGISGVINPAGKTIKSLPIFKEGIIDSKIYPSDKLTIYTRYGDLFAYICVLIIVGSLLSAFSSPRSATF